MKKLAVILITLLLCCNVSFADVVGPVFPGVTYMHGSGQYFDIITFGITMLLLFAFLSIIMLIVTLIMKKCNAAAKKIKIVRCVFLAIFIILFIATVDMDIWILN